VKCLEPKGGGASAVRWSIATDPKEDGRIGRHACLPWLQGPRLGQQTYKERNPRATNTGTQLAANCLPFLPWVQVLMQTSRTRSINTTGGAQDVNMCSIRNEYARCFWRKPAGVSADSAKTASTRRTGLLLLACRKDSSMSIFRSCVFPRAISFSSSISLSAWATTHARVPAHTHYTADARGGPNTQTGNEETFGKTKIR